MIDAIQRATFEALAPMGPPWSALGAGFAILWNGELHLTPAGQRYLSSLAAPTETLERTDNDT